MPTAALLALLAQVGTLHVVPLSHTDIGFTAPPSRVAEEAARAVGAAVARAGREPEFLWNIEVFWQLRQWLDRGGDEAAAVVLARKGRLGIGAAWANAHTSLMSAWALDRLFGEPAAWAKAAGLALEWAVLDDVPGHPPDLPDFLAAHGVKYLVLGVNQGFSPPLPAEVCNRPFFWEGPGGGRVLVWISAKGYAEAMTEYGIDPWSARFFDPKRFPSAEPLENMRAGIGRMLAAYEKSGYPYDAVLALHGFDNWGSGPAGRLPEALRLWNREGRKPALRLSTPAAFFREIEARHGKELPVRRGGFGGQWEVVRTGVPTALARAREEERRLARLPSPEPARVAALLGFWEHSWSLGPPWPGLLGREDAVRHNREQFELVRGWPGPPAPLARGKAGKAPEAPAGAALRNNGLYLAEQVFFGWGPLRPLPPEAWLEEGVEELPGGGLRLRQRIDRKRLPPTAHVIWAWWLGAAEGAVPVLVPTASGSMTVPGDGLAGYTLGHWIAPEWFRIGGTEFRPRGPFVFRREPRHPGWLLGRVLDQELEGTFKEQAKGLLEFEEAYPGEDPVLEITIDVAAPASRRTGGKPGGP